MQFKVPQNIDMEDKIIGPLTLKQFVYLMAGGMIFYVTLKAGNTTLALLVGLPAAVLAFCLAFIKIQDQPFMHFLSSFLLYLTRPKQRVWRREADLEMAPKMTKKAEPIKQRVSKEALDKTKLERLSQVLDTYGKIEMKEAKTQELKDTETKEHKDTLLNLGK